MEEDDANELLKRRRGRNGCACADALFTSPACSVDAAAPRRGPARVLLKWWRTPVQRAHGRYIYVESMGENER